MEIRAERPGDEQAIAKLIDAAFADAEHSDGTEAEIVERLRRADALAISLVAVDRNEIVGHVAASPVTIGGRDLGWLGIGPLAVLPGRQGEGIGAALMRETLRLAEVRGAGGCVLLGEPAYYSRFRFAPDSRLQFPGPPPEYFQALPFGRDMPSGVVRYHPAFGN